MLTVKSKIEQTRFWIKRAYICIILKDYKSALDRLNRASFEMDWIKIAMVYGDLDKSKI